CRYLRGVAHLLCGRVSIKTYEKGYRCQIDKYESRTAKADIAASPELSPDFPVFKQKIFAENRLALEPLDDDDMIVIREAIDYGEP
ncbi:hypothetical protein CFAM422_010873, partial [Trichoderma lentiforme]